MPAGVKSINVNVTDEQHAELMRTKEELAKKLGKDELSWADYLMATISLVKSLDKDSPDKDLVKAPDKETGKDA
jgi:hypothetical protein